MSLGFAITKKFVKEDSAENKADKRTEKGKGTNYTFKQSRPPIAPEVCLLKNKRNFQDNTRQEL